MQNVYKWPQWLQEFHNPNNHITPLVELSSELNPYLNSNIHIYSKLLYMNPLFNVRSIPAWYLINDLPNNDIDTIVESSSWNTALSLIIYGRLLWDFKTKCIVSSEVIQWKLDMLNLVGTDIIFNEEPICPDPNDPNSSINIAKSLWNEQWHYNPGQYNNKKNIQAHYEITGTQLFEQLPNIDCFIASLWTTWTMIGCSQYLQEKNKDIKTVWVVREENNNIPWPRTLWLLEHIEFDWKNYVDDTIKCSSYDAYYYSKKLNEYGILAWPSSGMQYYAALQIAEGFSQRYPWKEYHIVFISCDTSLPYTSLYSDILNEKFIWMKEDCINSQSLYHKLNTPNNNTQLLDIRSHQQYHEYHIPDSLHIAFNYIDEFIENLTDKNKDYIIICNYWSKSDIVRSYMKILWFSVQILAGWILEYCQHKEYPLCKHKSCLKN